MKAQPFVPFRIQVSDGATYEIPHPDFVLITHRTLHIGIPGRREFPLDTAICDLTHVTRLEPLPSKTTGNGRADGGDSAA